MNEQLLKECLALPIESRKALIGTLTESLSIIPNCYSGRGKELIEIVARIMELPAIPIKCRKESFAWAKAIAAYQMIKEGYTITAIGKMIGKSHCAVIHYRHKMENALAYPQMFHEAVTIWYQLQIELINGEVQQTTN